VAELSVREVARLLGVAEKTVWRWVRTGEIPHTRLREDVLFNRVELQEWALSSGHPLPPEVAGRGLSEGLAEAVARGGIARDLGGSTREEVLAAVAKLPGVPEGVDRGLETWEAVPAPRIVIAAGACAIAGGPFRGSSAASDGIPKEIPVDLYIPGPAPSVHHARRPPAAAGAASMSGRHGALLPALGGFRVPERPRSGSRIGAGGEGT
jgi:excisionase family DNA binding protein